VLAEAHKSAFAVHTEAEHAPLDKKKPDLHVKATVFDEHVAALVPQGAQALLLT